MTGACGQKYQNESEGNFKVHEIVSRTYNNSNLAKQDWNFVNYENGELMQICD